MTSRATTRLVTALVVAGAGLLLAVLAGRPEAAVVAAPWAVLVILGLSRRDVGLPSVALVGDRDRLVAGESVSLTATVTGVDGVVEVRWRPPASFVRTVAPPPDDNGSTGTSTTDAVDRGMDGDNGSEADDGDGDSELAVTARADVADRSGRVELTCSLPGTGWGSHDIGRIDLRLHRPYGLLTSTAVVRTTVPVRVHPRPIDLQRLLAPVHVRRLTGAHPSRAVGRGVEYADIRAYGPGDSVRDINWWASARSDQLLVSRRHPDRSTHLVLLVDSFVESGHDAWTMMGRTIEAAVGLAESHLSVSDRVGLVELGGIIRWVAPGSGRNHLQRLVDALLATRLYESEAERDVSMVPVRALPPRSLVVALSPLLDPRFLTAIGTLRAEGHDVAVIEFPQDVDPSSPRWSRHEHSVLALRLWRAERAALIDRLAGMGVAVAPWADDESLDLVLDRLTVARRHTRAVLRR